MKLTSLFDGPAEEWFSLPYGLYTRLVVGAICVVSWNMLTSRVPCWIALETHDATCCNILILRQYFYPRVIYTNMFRNCLNHRLLEVISVSNITTLYFVHNIFIL